MATLQALLAACLAVAVVGTPAAEATRSSEAEECGLLQLGHRTQQNNTRLDCSACSQKHGRHCNPSPFQNDPRCICGPNSEDWVPISSCAEVPQCTQHGKT